MFGPDFDALATTGYIPEVFMPTSEAELASALKAADPSKITTQEIADLEEASHQMEAEGGYNA
jgi:hypothetical protein